ncbi:MAG: RDD family protein, partial [Anaerolineae bacterium]
VAPTTARFAPRALARLLDLIFLTLTVMVFAPALGGYNSRAVTAIVGRELPLMEKYIPSVADLAFLFLMLFLPGVVFHTLTTWIAGATPLKWVVGVQVQRVDGRPPGFLPAFIRSAAMLVDGFLFGAIGHFAINRSALGQRLGDKWAGTVVVARRDLRPVALLRLAAAFVVSLAAAILTAGAVLLAQVLYDFYVVGLYG